jgi:hypothetical protein
MHQRKHGGPIPVARGGGVPAGCATSGSSSGEWYGKQARDTSRDADCQSKVLASTHREERISGAVNGCPNRRDERPWQVHQLAMGPGLFAPLVLRSLL